MKEICVFVQEDNIEFGLKAGDTVWLRETKAWSNEMVYNIFDDFKGFCVGSEVKNGRVFVRI